MKVKKNTSFNNWIKQSEKRNREYWLNQYEEIIEKYDIECKHNWEFIEGSWFKEDKFICKKCGGFKKIK